MAGPTSSLRNYSEELSTAGVLSPEERYALRPEGEFMKGTRLGAAGISAGALASEALNAEVSKDPEAAARARERALNIVRRADMYAPRVSSLRGIHSVGDAADFAAGALGQGAVSMVPSLAGAALAAGAGPLGRVAGFAGAAIPSYMMERGEAALNQYQDPVQMQASAEERDKAATVKGGVNALLDAIVPASIGGSILRKPAGTLLGHVAREAGTEAITEGAQQVVGYGAQKYLDPNKQLDPWDVADAAVAGGLTGGVMSAAGRAPSHAVGALAMPKMPTITNPFRRGDAPVGPEPGPGPGPGPGPEPGPEPEPEPGPEPGVMGRAADFGAAIKDRFADTPGEAWDKTAGVRNKAKDIVASTLDRMTEATKTAENPADFLRKVFGSDAGDEAAADLDGVDPVTLKGGTLEETADNIAKSDADRAARAAGYASDLLNDPNTPDHVRQRVGAMGEDFGSPESQKYIARALVAQRVGAKFAGVAQNISDLSKTIFSKGADFAQEMGGKIVKNNMQSASASENAAFEKVVFDGLTDAAKASPEIRSQLPDMARTLVAFAAKTGDITAKDLPTLAKLSDALSVFKDPDTMAQTLVEYAAVPRLEDSFISKIKGISSAQEDIKQPNSFLVSSLTPDAAQTLTTSQLAKVAKLVDQFSFVDSGSKKRGDDVVDGLAAAFGSSESARAVLDFYARQNKSKLAFDPNETLREDGSNPINEEGAPPATYAFKDAKALRPFHTVLHKDRHEMNRGAYGPNAEVARVPYGEYVASTGRDSDGEVVRIANDIKKRISNLEGRTEKRPEEISMLKNELEMLRAAYKSGGTKGALDLYYVHKVNDAEQNDLKATDEDLARYSLLTGAKDAKDTRITFQKKDGSKLMLSAESMWKSRGDAELDKEGAGKRENLQTRKHRLFNEAVASVLNRDDIDGVLTPLEKVRLDRVTKHTAVKSVNSGYYDLVNSALGEAEASISELKDKLNLVVMEAKVLVRNDLELAVEDYAQKTAPEDASREEINTLMERGRGALRNLELTTKDAYGAYGEGKAANEVRVEDIKTALRQNIARQQRLIDETDKKYEEAKRAGTEKDMYEGTVQRKAVLKERMKLYKAALAEVGEAEFEAKLESNESDSDDAAETSGVRYYEEDTGLAVGAEKRGGARKVGANPRTDKRVVLPKTGPYTAKDQAKSDKANKFIGRGAPGSSTEAYARAWGARANAGDYSKDDVIFVSANGNRPGALTPPWPEIKKAMSAKATIITDAAEDRARPFNSGERSVAEFLSSHGYAESSPGTWTPQTEEKAEAKAKAKAKALSDAALTALHDIVVKENYSRLDSPEKVLRFAEMAVKARDQLVATPEEERTEDQDYLRFKLKDMLDQREGKGFVFDWSMLFDGMRPSDAQRKELDGIVAGAQQVVKHSFVGAKADPKGAARADRALKAGASADNVWSTLGWFRGPDGKLRKEVRSPVFKARVRDFIKSGVPATLGDLIKGVPEFAAYAGTPLASTTLEMDNESRVLPVMAVIGGFVPENNAVYLSPEGARFQAVIDALGEASAEKVVFDTMKSGKDVMASVMGAYPRSIKDLNQATEKLLFETAMHEIQHAIQKQEGFDNGGNLESGVVAKYGDLAEYSKALKAGDTAKMSKLADEAANEMLAQLGPDADVKSAAERLYYDIVGEAEAFDVEARMGLSNEEAKGLKPALADAKREFLRSASSAILAAKIRQKAGAKSSMRPDPNKNAGAKDARKAIIDEVARMRGKDVKVAFGKFVDPAMSGRFSMNADKTKRLIEIAINSLNPMGVAWHESLHDFFATLDNSPEERRLKEDLLTAAEAPQVKAKLRTLLKDHPEARKQIEEDREERLAYMFQFWAEGHIVLGNTGTNIFARMVRFINEMLGVVGKDQKTDMLFSALLGGKFSEPSTVGAVLQDLRANTLKDKIREVSGPIGVAADALLTGATDRLRNTNIPALTELADKFHREPGREQGSELPFLQRRAQEVGKHLNQLQAMLEKTTAEERRTTLKNMQSMKPPVSTLEKKLASYLEDMHTYMRQKGVRQWNADKKQWEDIGYVKNYFPRYWDKEAIRGNEGDFLALLEPYIGKNQARSTFNALVNGDGSLELAENEHTLGFTPWNPSVLDRKFTFIDASNAEEFAKFQSGDLTDILTSYTQRAVHRAEYAKDFGNDGEKIAQAFKKALEQGASEKELALANKAVMALEGTLGNEFNPRLKEVMSGIITIENLVLLPLSLFSNFVDPLGIALRSGDMKEAGRAFLYGMKGLIDQIRRADPDADTEMAKTLGLIDDQNMLEAMGQVYNSMHMSRALKKINSKFFRYNGMERWNQSMRVAAMVAAQRFIRKQVENLDKAPYDPAAENVRSFKNLTELAAVEGVSDAKTTAERYLKELGITKNDVLYSKNGGILLTKSEIMATGASESTAAAIEKRIQAAVFKWVDGAVLRPNAAHRPIWGSDPAYQLIFHLKQFTFSFQNVILRRMDTEMQHENGLPAIILMSYVPFMFASDLIKGTLTGSITASTSLYDVATASIARSGILGTQAFSSDVLGDASRGQVPGTSFLGPAFGHVMTLLKGLTGHASLDQVMDRSMPLYRFM
jgi:hypothetical protein